jgi:hypothetical protein
MMRGRLSGNPETADGSFANFYQMVNTIMKVLLVTEQFVG